ncbi:hypothetical protein FA13DRAFT_1776357 [Coprinellus micaceus]|uniref:Fungal-type protein kinase domain-containing protein n=1 Tax=Coprinellus micaceus TaxID=71717 RepID=A0A4Y7T1I0_COPMI|nr:hypothetical protein FA13DRAFT_1776357 [Coprinellus micaceus]
MVSLSIPLRLCLRRYGRIALRSVSTKRYQDHVLRMMWGEPYRQLWEVGSIENFKQAWLDCLEWCSRFQTNGTVKGVLVDWNMSKPLRQHDNTVTESPRYINLPTFMAIDLLNKSGAHLYRPDLESFLYILIWAAVHYDLANGQRDIEVHPSLEPWVDSRRESYDAKHRVICPGPGPMALVYRAVKPEFKGLLEEWTKPLRSLFIRDIMTYHELSPEEVKSDAAEETYGGQLTFKTFMAALKGTPRTWGIANFLNDDD